FSGLAPLAAQPLDGRTPLGDLSTMSLSDDLKGTVRAPEFPAGDAWLNTDHPLTMRELRGKIVLLDFWTYCCINCMHVIPDLKRLEEKYKDSLVVIGVHSAKFKTEKDTANIREAVLRYEVHHPVVNDADFQIWNSYGIQAWPSFALINPEGRVVGLTSGEGVYNQLDPILAELTAHYKEEGKLDLNPFHYASEAGKVRSSFLAFPGKLAADEKSDTLVISDSNHNRILVTDLEGKVKTVIGSGQEGLKDGDFKTAEFFHPQGVYLDPETQTIYVADTENHAIRKIDLKTKTVSTLAGNGKQAAGYNQEGPGKTISLNSPWDVLKKGDLLYIAMAGSHQIWTLNLTTNAAKVFAGSSRENIQDGPLQQAALAQTSGLSTDGQHLYFVDSETSSLRETGFSPSDSVTTLVGKGLFDFGDTNGPAPHALFQHPIGVAYHDGSVYVADTYNNQVRRYDLKTQTVSTLLGGKESGLRDGDAAQSLLNEPCGLAFAGDRLYIADTNNQLIRVYDLKTRKISSLTLSGLASADLPASSAPGPSTVLKAQTVNRSVHELRFHLSLPAGLLLNAQAPSRLEVTVSDPSVAKFTGAPVSITSGSLSVPVELHPGQTTVTFSLTLFYCSHGHQALCYFKQAHLILPLSVVSKGGSDHLALDYAVH
ncbi:MAG: thioredoxin-like domain-containing protein, partial [bacterium]